MLFLNSSLYSKHAMTTIKKAVNRTILSINSKSRNNYIVGSNINGLCTSNTENIQVQDSLRELDYLINNKSYSQIHHSKNIVIDFSSPNIAKPFHVGHLRSTIIGNFISNINRYFNNNVTSINYLGDWGTQFGLLQYGIKANKIQLENLEQDPIKSLYNAYVEANKQAKENTYIFVEARKYFSEIEQGKIDLNDWRKIKNITVFELEKIYKRLRVKFDEYHWESDYNAIAIRDLISLLERKQILKTDDTGRKVAQFRDKYITIFKSDNSSLYISRDLAALIDRHVRYNFDEMLYVVDNSQTSHFEALFEIASQVDKKYARGCRHIKFGRLHGMSTRSGNAVFLNDILDEAKVKMYEQQKMSKNTRTAAMDEETCDILGTTAVVINDLKQRRSKDYEFSWDRALQSEGDSGIKLQYLHCRLWSLEQNCGVKLPDVTDPKYLTEPVIQDVIAELLKFEDILLRAKEQYEACLLLNYLFKLSKHVNRMFKELKVKGESSDVASHRLLIFHSARLVVKRSLELLGIKPLLEM